MNASTDKPQYTPGETATITGRVLDDQSNPVAGADVSIQVDDPQGTTIHVQLTFSDQSGEYSNAFTLSPNSAQGQYQVFVSARKAGFENTQTHLQFNVQSPTVTSSTATSSSQATTTSSQTTNPPAECFIATATYGSELSPEVALLRNFRDADVMRTSAGRSFMTTFNAVYYSFSPQVASLIASNNILRTVMKIILYPLIGVLYMTNRVFTKLAFNPELAVALSGIFASLAIGMIYLGPIAVVLDRFAGWRRLLEHRAISALALSSCAASTASLVVAELAHLSLLLTIAAVVTVLTYLVLGGLAVLYWASHAQHPPR